MLFHVAIEVRLPPDLDPYRLTELRAAERERSRELQEAGTIRGIWRVVGRLANIGLWEAPDHETLHEAITSLPLSPYFDVTVTPLARHPNSLSLLGSLPDSRVDRPAAVAGLDADRSER
jgi:muconolactone D-isomerase